MSTFLQLCEQFREEVGVAGTISTTVGQVGMHRRLINYIKKANRKIQSRKTNWKFLWEEWSRTITDSETAEFTPPDGLRQFDETSFWLDAGTADAIQLKYIDYKAWRDVYRHQYDVDTFDQPVFVAIKPNGKVAVLPGPSTDYVGSIITADYWKTPVELTDNGQPPLIPAQFHDIIVAQAKIYFAEKFHDTGLYNSAFIEHEDWYRDLKSHSLPGNEDDNKSQSSIFHVIEIL
jgi:hypothetical protein